VSRASMLNKWRQIRSQPGTLACCRIVSHIADMRSIIRLSSLDTIDSKAIALLMERGRLSWAELGSKLGLSAPAAAERVHRLEGRGVLREYRAIPDPDAVGFPILAFVKAALGRPDSRAAFVRGVRRNPFVLECHHVAGEDDYLLKVRCRSIGDLEKLLVDEIRGKLGAKRTNTVFVLSTAKETSTLPVGK
jgi:Lrp/AsnC family leucine-responsive transcriptional regulator